jgi:hypothetical protein
MKQNLRTGHRGNPVELRVAAIAANHEGAFDAVDFEQRELVAASAVFFFVTPGHVHLCVFVHYLTGGIDHVCEVQMTVGRFPQRAGNHPNLVRPCRRTRLRESIVNLRRIERRHQREVVACEARLRK